LLQREEKKKRNTRAKQSPDEGKKWCKKRERGKK
jgi:hypothetical protein